MEQREIHQVFLRAAIECAERGVDAKTMAQYLKQAAEGMGFNAAFCMSPERVAEVLREELES